MKAWLPLVALALYAGVGLAWISASRPARQQAFEAYSSLNTSDAGLSLARAYLAARGRDVTSMTQPFELARVPGKATLLRIRPSAPSILEWMLAGEGAGDDDASDRVRSGLGFGGNWLPRAEREWVQAGGRLVLALDATWWGVGVDETDATLVKAHPRWPAVRSIEPSPARTLAGSVAERAHALFLAGDAPMIAAVPMGRGEVLLMACPEIFRNDALAKADHLALLEALSGTGPVVFDERAHGLVSEVRLLTLIGSWGLGACLLLLGVAVIATAWRAAVRLGPPGAESPERRSVAVDLVDSLAALYRAALRRKDALALYGDALAREVAMNERLRGERLDARLADLLQGWKPPSRGGRGSDMPQPAFARGLETINNAFERLRREHRR